MDITGMRVWRKQDDHLSPDERCLGTVVQDTATAIDYWVSVRWDDAPFANNERAGDLMTYTSVLDHIPPKEI